jgi:hypothetical protein
MADPNLASIIAGNDPLSPQMLQGYQGSQLSNAAIDPDFARNSGPLGALAHLIAGVSGHDMLQNAVQNTTQARTAAQPSLASLLANPNPYQAFADNPQQYGPIAGAGILNGASPETVANARLAAANAQLAGLNVGGFTNAQANPPPATAGIGAPPTRRIAPLPAGNFSALGSGRYSPAPAGAPGAASTPDMDPIAMAAALPPQQRQAMLQNPQIRARYLALLQQRALAQRAQPPATMGGGNAAGP